MQTYCIQCYTDTYYLLHASLACMHKHTHKHITYVHTYIHTYYDIHTYIRTRMHTYILHTYVHKYCILHTYIHACIPTNIHTDVQTDRLTYSAQPEIKRECSDFFRRAQKHPREMVLTPTAST